MYILLACVTILAGKVKSRTEYVTSAIIKGTKICLDATVLRARARAHAHTRTHARTHARPPTHTHTPPHTHTFNTHMPVHLKFHNNDNLPVLATLSGTHMGRALVADLTDECTRARDVFTALSPIWGDYLMHY